MNYMCKCQILFLPLVGWCRQGQVPHVLLLLHHLHHSRARARPIWLIHGHHGTDPLSLKGGWCTDLLVRTRCRGREEIWRFDRSVGPRLQRGLFARKRAKLLSNKCSSQIHFWLLAMALPCCMARKYI